MAARREINWCDEDPEVDPFVVFEVGDDITLFNRKTDYGLLLVQGGVFPSVSQAWKHGYKGKIPAGYTEFKLYGCKIYIYNPLDMPPLPEIVVPAQYKALFDRIYNGIFDLSKPQPEMEALREKIDPVRLHWWWQKFNDIDFSFATLTSQQKRTLKFDLINDFCVTEDEKAYGVWCIAIQ